VQPTRPSHILRPMRLPSIHRNRYIPPLCCCCALPHALCALPHASALCPMPISLNLLSESIQSEIHVAQASVLIPLSFTLCSLPTLSLKRSAPQTQCSSSAVLLKRSAPQLQQMSKMFIRIIIPNLVQSLGFLLFFILTFN
jgi:hypothetical protein